MGRQVHAGFASNAPVQIGGEGGDDDGASLVYTKRWDVTAAAAENATHTSKYNFDIVTSDPAILIGTSPGGTCANSIELETKNAVAVSTSNPSFPTSLKTCTIAVTRGPDLTKDADVRFEVELSNGKELNGRIRVRP